MNKEQRSILLKAASICEAKELRQRNLSTSDLIQSLCDEHDDFVIGAEIIKYMCSETVDESPVYNKFLVGLRVALRFMEERTGVSSHDKQLYVDLKERLENGKFDQIERYFRAFFVKS